MVVVLSLVVFGFSMMPNAAQASTDVLPPAPTQEERCGTAYDELFIPVAENATYFRDVVNYDASLQEGAYLSVAGATYVKIIAEYMVVGPDGWAYNKQHVFEYTFDTSAPNGCVQAADTGRVDVGACDNNSGRTTITITYTNTPEAGGQFVDRVELLAYGSSGIVWSIPVTLGRVLDGQTVSWTGGLDSTYPVYPSHYVGELMTFNPHRVLVSNVKFTVGACGDYPLVEPDDGGSTGGSSASPTAKLKLVKCVTGRVRGTLNNQKLGSPTRFKLVKDPARGKTVSRTYKVKPRSLKKVYQSGTNSVYKVFFYKTKTKRWVKLDRLRSPSQSRCG